MESKIEERESPEAPQTDSLLGNLLRVRQESNEVLGKLETAIDRMARAAGIDAHAPPAIAEKAETVGTNKGKLNALSTILLGILAGVFIGLGGMFYAVVTTNSGLGFGMTRLVGGVAFSLGLILVVVAGAELFTGNNLIVMSWFSGRTSFGKLMRNWTLVYIANMIGAFSLVLIMYYTNQFSMNGNALGANALVIANGKVNLAFGTALARGIMCNALVCLAVWLCFSARGVGDKILAILFPITAFVAAGFEHSVANMYFIPMGILLSGRPEVLGAAGLGADALTNLNWVGFVTNLVPVTIGNIIGGGLLIGVVYWLAYLRKERAAEAIAARPWLRVLARAPEPARPVIERPVYRTLPEGVLVQLESLIRAKEKPVMLDPGGKALLDVLARVKHDPGFLAKLSDNQGESLKEYNLTQPEAAALLSGDIRWIESKLGPISDPLRTWLTARLAQEKW